MGAGDMDTEQEAHGLKLGEAWGSGSNFLFDTYPPSCALHLLEATLAANWLGNIKQNACCNLKAF